MSRANNQPPDPERWLDNTVRDATSLVDRRDFMKATGIAAMLGAAGASQVSAQEAGDDYYRKTRPTAFTEEERQNALNNIERYDWAKDYRDGFVENAETILEYWDYEQLWRLVPSQLVPRGNALAGSGNTYMSTAQSRGWYVDKMDPEFTLYAVAPSFNWEVTNENSGITIPTNDFSAYRESGRDDEGKFDPELADDSLLVNTKHPELGEGWGVDDGTGFVDEEGHIGSPGTQWNPVSWLNHWAVIYPIRQFIWRLSMAYILTGDQKYARPAAILLDRTGDVYPDLNHQELFDYYGRSFSNSSGGTGQGRFVGAIWESSQIREWLWSYDRIFPGMDGDDELVSFLDAKQDEYSGLAPKDTLGAIRENTESGFIHEMLPAFEHAQIRGNFGFHQSTLAVAAVVADDPEGMTGDAIDYVFQPGTLLHPNDENNPTPGRWYTTGGDIMGFLLGSPQSGYMVDEDGYPTESAPHYNTSQQNSMLTFANAVGGYDGYEGADIFQNPKFKRAMDSHWQLTMLGKYTPQIANTHGCGNPKAIGGLSHRTIQSSNFALTGFDQYRTTELAQWTYMLNGLSTDGLEFGIFHPEPENIREDIRQEIDEHGPVVDLDSVQQPAYGFTALRDGENETVVSEGGGGSDLHYEFIDLPRDASTDVQEFSTPAVQLEATEEDHWIEFEFEVPEGSDYSIVMETNMAPSYGIYEVFVSGESIGTYDFYGSPNLTIEADLELEVGTNTIRFENRGKNEDSSNYKVALYWIELSQDQAAIETPDNFARGIYQYYGRNSFGTGSAHTHRDTLNLGVYGYDLDLSPELARQGSDHEGNYLGAWVESTPAHNTVTVDEENVHPQWVGYPKHFDHTDHVQLMDVDAPRAYPQTDEYRRTTAMINSGEKASYVVDFFRVDGGGDHHFSFHAMTSHDVATEGLELEAQNGGTYEGEHVGFRQGGYFSYLYDVSRDDSPEPGFAVDWNVEDYWDVRRDDGTPVHLRLTMLNEVDDVALATGRPAEQETELNPEELPFLIAHRAGEREETDEELHVAYGDSITFDGAERTGSVSSYQGIRVEPHRDLAGVRVQIDPDTNGIGHATIRDTDGNVLAERDVSGVGPGDYVDIPYDGLEAGTQYLVVFGNYGESYGRASSGVDYPVESEDFTVDSGIYTESGSATTSWRYNVTEIQAITEYEEPDLPEPEPISSTFTSIIEPYEGERAVASAELVPVTTEDEDADLDAAQAVKVKLVDGRTDYVVSSTDTESDFVIDDALIFKGAFGVYSLRDGEEEFVYANDAKLFRTKGRGAPAIQHNQAAFEGTVDDFTKALSLENKLEITIANNPRDVDLEDLEGHWIYVDPAPHDPVPDGVIEDDRYDNVERDRRNGVFPIEGVERIDDERAVIDVGSHTFIRRYYTNDPADGYSYSIEEGAEFVIPYGTLVE